MESWRKDAFFDEGFLFQPIGDKVANGDDFYIVLPSLFEELGHTRHGAVVVHDFDKGGGGIETGEARHIDSGFGVPCPFQYAFVLCI